MRHLLSGGALALALTAGAALVTAPASADSIQRDGYFGGTWEPIGPQNNRFVRRYQRKYGYYPGRYAYYGPPAYYAPAPGYYYGPGYYAPRGGFGFGIMIP